MIWRTIGFLCCFVLAIIINVAVAWSCTCFSSLDWSTKQEFDLSADVSEWPFPTPGDWPSPDERAEFRGFGIRQEFYQWTEPREVTMHRVSGWPGIDGGGKYYLQGVFSAGLPLRSLARTGTFGGNEGWVFEEWSDPPYASELGISVSEGLPIRPLWPGFMINTLFYAIILWLLLLAPFQIRRAMRIRGRRCPKCGYPAGESPVCTECGCELPNRLEIPAS